MTNNKINVLEPPNIPKTSQILEAAMQTAVEVGFIPNFVDKEKHAEYWIKMSLVLSNALVKVANLQLEMDETAGMEH